MSVTIKGDSPFDAYIVSRIKDCQTEHIKFYNISFNCKTIEDADGRTFTRSEERKKGKWIHHPEWEEDGDCSYECSECHMGSDVDYNFCMRCGADMRGDEDEAY